MDKYGQMGYIMLINYDKLIYSLTCGCCFAVFVMEHLGMGYPKSSTEPVSHVDLSHSTNKKTEQNHATPILYTGFIQRSLMKMLSHLKKYQVDSPGTFKQ